jgi:hypothetical protein
LQVDLALQGVDGVEGVFHVTLGKVDLGLVHLIDVLGIEDKAASMKGRSLHLRDQLETILNRGIVGAYVLQV